MQNFKYTINFKNSRSFCYKTRISKISGMCFWFFFRSTLEILKLLVNFLRNFVNPTLYSVRTRIWLQNVKTSYQKFQFGYKMVNFFNGCKFFRINNSKGIFVFKKILGGQVKSSYFWHTLGA